MHFGPNPALSEASIQQAYQAYKRKITQFEGVLREPGHRILCFMRARLQISALLSRLPAGKGVDATL
jgi:hypothetical protein